MSAIVALQEAINIKLRRTYTSAEIGDVLSALTAAGYVVEPGWQDIADAPRDGTPILAWCDHEAGERYNEEQDPTGRCLSLYMAHGDGMGFAPTGLHIIEWGGAFDDSTWEYPDQASLPDWWFVVGSEFEMAANPTHWRPLPAPPAQEPQS